MPEVSGTGSRQVTGSGPGGPGGAENVQRGRTAIGDIIAEGDAAIQEINSLIDEKLSAIEYNESRIEYYERYGRRPNPANSHRLAVDRLNNEIDALRLEIPEIEQDVRQQIQDLNSLDNLLANGDIEGAFMLVQTNRTLSLDRQIAERLEELQARNEQIKSLNDQLAAINRPDNELTPDQRETKVALRGQIDQLNADSQLDTIKLQSLINKRNQALEMLTNILQKLQKVLDSIVGNMR